MLRTVLVGLRNQWLGALALLIALGTGTAYAANTVFSSDIVDGEVRSADLQDNGVSGVDVDESSLQAARVMLRSRTNVTRTATYPD